MLVSRLSCCLLAGGIVLATTKSVYRLMNTDDASIHPDPSPGFLLVEERLRDRTLGDTLQIKADVRKLAELRIAMREFEAASPGVTPGERVASSTLYAGFTQEHRRLIQRVGPFIVFDE